MTTKHVWEHKPGEWIVEVLTKHFAQMHVSDPFQTWWRTHGSRSEETGQNTRGRILRRRAARDIDYAAAAASRLLLLIDGITRRSDQQKGAEIRCNLCTGGNCSTLCRRTTHGRIFLLSQHSGSLSSLLSVFALIAFHQLPVVARDQCSGTKGGAFCRILSWKGKKDFNSSQIEDKFNSIPLFVFCSDAQTEFSFQMFSAMMHTLRFMSFLQWWCWQSRVLMSSWLAAKFPAKSCMKWLSSLSFWFSFLVRKGSSNFSSVKTLVCSWFFDFNNCCSQNQQSIQREARILVSAFLSLLLSFNQFR